MLCRATCQKMTCASLGYRNGRFTMSMCMADLQVLYFRYVVLAVKNADGFTLFPSGRSKWNSVDVGPKKDIVEIVSQAVRKYDIKFGVHYSLLEGCNKLFLGDMERGNTTVYTDTIVWPDIKLLIEKYRPSLLWADGKKYKGCQQKLKCNYWKLPKLWSWLYNASSVRDKIVVNDGWCRTTKGRYGDVYQFESRKLNLILLYFHYPVFVLPSFM